MKLNKQVVFTILLLTLVAALYRIVPGRPFGFAPQIAMAVFAGAIFKNKKWAFAIPVISMLLSDVFYQVLYMNGLSEMQGFYEGQWQNYLLFALLVLIGFAIRKINLRNVFLASLMAPTVYFLLSNFLVWASYGPTAGYNRPKTFSGLMMCYGDGIPFYKWSIVATLVFSAIFFGTYYLVNRKKQTLVNA
ncbi:MAG: hypothetical protein JST58_12530 [Bacteroidetes bacterium]|jgi:hypothetical protein|nr:hypothetical protein [Bacteroidota bacterium]